MEDHMIAKKVFRCTVWVASLGCLLNNAAYGVSIFAGSDYLSTTSASFDFGGAVGVVPLTGAFGMGVADTVLTRLANANLPRVGSTDTIGIQMRLLELQSIAPVNVNGTLFNVAVHLNPNAFSTGSMTINHTLPDNGTAAAEGTFTSNLIVNFLANFVQAGGTMSFAQTGSLALTTTPPASWSHNPPAGVLLVNGLPGDLDANCHNPPICTTLANNPGIVIHDFFTISVMEVHPGVGIHLATPATTICPGCPNVPPLQMIVPEPGTYAPSLWPQPDCDRLLAEKEEGSLTERWTGGQVTPVLPRHTVDE